MRTQDQTISRVPLKLGAEYHDIRSFEVEFDGSPITVLERNTMIKSVMRKFPRDIKGIWGGIARLREGCMAQATR